MTPKLALDLSEDGISLLHRLPNGKGWEKVGFANIDSDTLTNDLKRLRKIAIDLEGKNFSTKLIIPESQLLYDVVTVGPNVKDDVEWALELRTPYRADQLSYDFTGEGVHRQVVAVARQTLEEAEAFLKPHRLNPLGFTAVPTSDQFDREPFLGPFGESDGFVTGSNPVRIVDDTETIRPTVVAKTDDEEPTANAPPADEVEAAEEPEESAEAPLEETLSSATEDTETANIDESAEEDSDEVAETAEPEEVQVDEEIGEEQEPVEAALEETEEAEEPSPETVEELHVADNSEIETDPAIEVAPEVETEVETASETDPGEDTPQDETEAAAFSSRRSISAEDAASTGDRVNKLTSRIAVPSTAPKLAGMRKTPNLDRSNRDSAEPPLTSDTDGAEDTKKSAPSVVAPPFHSKETVVAKQVTNPIVVPVDDLAPMPPVQPTAASTSAEMPLSAPANRDNDDDVAIAVVAATAPAEPSSSSFLGRGALLTAALITILALFGYFSTFLFPSEDLAGGEDSPAVQTEIEQDNQQAATEEPPLETVISPDTDVATDNNITAPAPLNETEAEAPEVEVARGTEADDGLNSAQTTDEDIAGTVEEDVPPFAETELAALPTDTDLQNPATTLTDEEAAELEIPPVPTPMTLPEAEAAYAVSGVWQKAPEINGGPRSPNLNDLTISSLGKPPNKPELNLLRADTLAQPDVSIAALPSPPPSGTDFEFGEDGFVLATPEGALTPDGVLVIAGTPPVPARQRPASAVEQQLDEQNARLAQIRPTQRPGTVEFTPTPEEDDPLIGGLTRAELVERRPQPRPQSAQAQAAAIAEALAEAAGTEPDETLADEGTELAIAASLVPASRPASIAQRAEQVRAARAAAAASAGTGEATTEDDDARARGPAVARASRANPTAPTSSSVARAATDSNALPLGKVTLIGVFGSDSSRRALVRMPNGRFKKVTVGDRVDGGRVAAIGADQLRYVKNGRTLTLRMPSS